MNGDQIYVKVSVAPWVGTALWLLQKTVKLTVPVFGADTVVNFAKWLVAKGQKVEIVKKS